MSAVRVLTVPEPIRRRLERGDCTTNWRHPLSDVWFGGMAHDQQLTVHLSADHHVHPYDIDGLDLFGLIGRHIAEHQTPTDPHCRSCSCHVGRSDTARNQPLPDAGDTDG